MSRSPCTSSPLVVTSVQESHLPASATERVFDSRALFQGRQRVFIEHAGQRYQLRLTRENKLILTK